MGWFEILGLAFLLVSTILGSVLAYIFALRTARRERLHEVKVASYSRYLQTLARMSKAADALLLVVSPQKDPDARFEALTKAARMVFQNNDFRQVMEKSRNTAFEVTKSGKARTDREAFVLINKMLEEPIIDQITGIVVSCVYALEDEEIVLRMVGSSAIDGREAGTMRAMFTLVLGTLMATRTKGTPQEIQDLTPKLVKSLEDSITDVATVVENEVKATL